jgi:hypothetical protein
MTPRQRKALDWLKEWGGLIAGVIGALSSGVVAFLVASGYSIGTPTKLFAQLEARVSVLEREHKGLEPVHRFLCSLDPERGYLAGIPGCDKRANNVPGR